jgi:hypothetical protein
MLLFFHRELTQNDRIIVFFFNFSPETNVFFMLTGNVREKKTEVQKKIMRRIDVTARRLVSFVYPTINAFHKSIWHII